VVHAGGLDCTISSGLTFGAFAVSGGALLRSRISTAESRLFGGDLGARS
jgi:hypothetical protein